MCFSAICHSVLSIELTYLTFSPGLGPPGKRGRRGRDGDPGEFVLTPSVRFDTRFSLNGRPIRKLWNHEKDLWTSICDMLNKCSPKTTISKCLEEPRATHTCQRWIRCLLTDVPKGLVYYLSDYQQFRLKLDLQLEVPTQAIHTNSVPMGPTAFWNARVGRDPTHGVWSSSWIARSGKKQEHSCI